MENLRSAATTARRLFMRYRIAPKADGGFLLHEDYRERDRRTGFYADKSCPTAIALTEGLQHAQAERPSVIDDLERAAADLRRMLDREGVKIYFDRPKSDPKSVFAKWKYRLTEFEEDPIDRRRLPPELLQMVQDDERYYEKDTWKKWFGPRMQRKREGIIAEELRTRFPEFVVGIAPGSELDEVTEAGAAATPAAAAEATAPGPALTPELAAGIAMLVDRFAPLFRLPEEAHALLDHVTAFSAGLFEYQFVGNGPGRTVKPRPMLPPEQVRDAARKALGEKFAEDPQITAALEERPKNLLDRNAPGA